MKLATFAVPSPAGSVRRIGALADGWLVDLQVAYAAYLARTDVGCEAERLAALLLPDDMVTFLGHGTLGWDAASRAVEEGLRIEEAFGRRTRYRLDEIRLLAPLPRPRVIRDFLTFEGHMRNASRALGRGGEVPPAWYEVRPTT
ncbi:MAG: fumarylacetoacetate hydrolase family protein, partial [Thermomicrobium sp.]|nr:fumarylacetoacetate hydrolase family protein [Thermomicrobium sp.]